MDSIHSVSVLLIMRFQIKKSSSNVLTCRVLKIGKTNDQNNRITYIFHPAYIDYITKNNQDTIDYRHAENWEMPEKSFFDYLFHK